ncbi:MAG TPA: hypothetical protein VFD04_19025 [Actinomycetes bacterium]|nr:hypothetical protein [Actinomycetes bacterium]
MALKDELTEPWGLLLGGAAFGTAWAVGLPLAAAGAVGAAVWATKAATAAWEGRRGGRRRPRGELPVDARSAEGVWLQRAQRAAASFAELARSMTAGPLADRVATMGPEVDDTVRSLGRLAGQATAAGRALARIDDAALDAEAARLQRARHGASGDVAAELDRSLASVRAQRQVHDRLAAAHQGVLARLESGTLGLESLVARVVELSAMTAGGPAGDVGGVGELGDELEGIRQGLAETEEVSRQALSAFHRNDRS